MANWRGAWNAGALYAPGDQVGYGGTVWLAAAASTGQLPSPGAYWTVQGAEYGSGPVATTASEGDVQLAGDLGGTADSPQVVSSHFASPLPVAQGGTGVSTAYRRTYL